MSAAEKIWIKATIVALSLHSLMAFVFIFLEIQELNKALASPFVAVGSQRSFARESIKDPVAQKQPELPLDPEIEERLEQERELEPEISETEIISEPQALDSQNREIFEVPLAVPAPGKEFVLDEYILFETEDIEETEEETEEETVMDFSSAKVANLPVLMYHHIDYVSANDSAIKRRLTVTPEIFERQMKHLYDNNYQPIVFQDALSYLEAGEGVPENSLIITFDDGWKNQYQHAFPVLKKYGFRATFFPVVNYVGGGSFMNWDDIKNLSDNGMEIGSHSMNHPNLRGLSANYLRHELKSSKNAIENELDIPVVVFAYPYCSFNSYVKKAAYEAGYQITRFCGANDRFVLRTVNFNGKQGYNIDSMEVHSSISQFRKYFP